MKKTNFTEAQILKAIGEYKKGRDVQDICIELEISKSVFYKWCQRYGRVDLSEQGKVNDQENDNSRLKTIFAELSLVHEALKIAAARKF